MTLWRISRHRDLKGAGGIKAAGRWHHAGLPVVYLAASPPGALLEACAHTSANDVPPDYTLLKIEGPDLAPRKLRPGTLPKDWRNRVELTRNLGSAWLNMRETLLLLVPSALVPETSNYLFNPAHPDARRFRIVSKYSYPFDSRLKQ
jgi:RES domain-containing protein